MSAVILLLVREPVNMDLSELRLFEVLCFFFDVPFRLCSTENEKFNYIIPQTRAVYDKIINFL